MASSFCLTHQLVLVCQDLWEDCAEARAERAVEAGYEHHGKDHRPAATHRSNSESIDTHTRACAHTHTFENVQDFNDELLGRSAAAPALFPHRLNM